MLTANSSYVASSIEATDHMQEWYSRSEESLWIYLILLAFTILSATPYVASNSEATY